MSNPTKNQRVVSMNYVLKDDSGEIMDQSTGEPLHYLEGANNIIPGLEKALLELNPGDKKQVTVAPEEAYGVYHDDLSFTMGREQFGDHTPEVGQVLEIGDQETTVQAAVEKVDGDTIYLNANHPLAGKTLHFDIEITATRAAEEEELQHGHPHMGDDHGHHH